MTNKELAEKIKNLRYSEEVVYFDAVDEWAVVTADKQDEDPSTLIKGEFLDYVQLFCLINNNSDQIIDALEKTNVS